jgi:hypothetical protein
MFAFDRDTATLVAIVVCIAATAYLFRELKKTREEFTAAIAEKQQPVMYMAPEPVELAPVPAPEPVAPKVMTTRKKAATAAEKESDE